jgi:acetate---CoA ligase (ADP-forming)
MTDIIPRNCSTASFQEESFDAIFSPSSVAVIGASSKPGKVGHDIFKNILQGGFQGVLYPVNPRADSVACVKCYSSIAEIPGPVDLAMIILPPLLAKKAVEEAILKGVKAIVIVSAGFREVGGEGKEIEDQIIAVCKEAHVRVVGPNCLGIINPQASVKLNASFAARMPKAGNISFISQSGALCTAVLDFAADLDVGFSKFISIGNKADIDELDLLRYFHKDKGTDVIMIYLEELRRGPEFITAVKEITCGERPTPVLVIKSGRTSQGAAAAASHTGALAGTEGVYDAIFKQAGILRVDNIDELFDFAKTFAAKTVDISGNKVTKFLHGNRLAIVTNAGGPGIVGEQSTLVEKLWWGRARQISCVAFFVFSDGHDGELRLDIGQIQRRNNRDVGLASPKYRQSLCEFPFSAKCCFSFLIGRFDLTFSYLVELISSISPTESSRCHW